MLKKTKSIIILGIETSCDDTSLALYDAKQSKVIAQITRSQLASHAKYGGIVPEIASREHLTSLPHLFTELLKAGAIKKNNIDLIAVTQQPGLIGSLLIGVSYAKALAFSLNIPVVGIDHLKAHIFSVFLEQSPPLKTPFISLLVSGGHTHLFLVKAINDISLLGRTLDDACGEAFDKTAQMLGLTYPGGASIEKLAQLVPSSKQAPLLPITFKGKKTLDFSYSGLKTAVRNLLIAQKSYFPGQELLTFKDFITNKKANAIENASLIAKGFQTAALDQLLTRLDFSITKTGLKTVSICGGVAANQELRQKIAILCAKKNLTYLQPLPQYTQDNGAMVAFLAYLSNPFKIRRNMIDLNLEPKAISNLSFKS